MAFLNCNIAADFWPSLLNSRALVYIRVKVIEPVSPTASLCDWSALAELRFRQNNLAGVYEASQEYNEAINALYKTIEIAQINKNETLTLNAKYNLARMMVKVGDVKMALVLYKEVIQALKSSNKAFGLNIREIYNEYYDLYNKTQVKK